MPFKAKLMYYFVPAHAPWVYKEETMEKKNKHCQTPKWIFSVC